jgi:outer membrane protein TolC
VKPDSTASLATAFKLRPEYLSSRKKIEREDIRMVFAENQRWPQLDLKGSYNMNGLDNSSRYSLDRAMNRDYETWSVGVELRIPLGGDKKSKSELEATKQRKRQALLELKAVEVSLANAVDTAVNNVYNLWEQARHHASIVEMNRRLLDTEIERFKAGKSNSRTVLEREENLHKAKEVEIESLVKYRKALFQLDMTEGSLLVNNDIEVMEVGSK